MDSQKTDQPLDQIKHIDIEEEMKTSYLRYAMSVIVSRALPDVRDGFKPSQRRIIVAMNDLHLNPKAKYRKCAKIVGDTNGNYHPHGDSAVYQTLVRMAQDFSINCPMVEGQGNFGSVDGDPPAAMRYTEAKMDAHAVEMVEDLEYDTVDFQPNYDDTREEPTILPGRFPNLLCNGASGIAVGVATNLVPHNLAEICDGIRHLIDYPDCTLKDLLHHVKGPDFPTGGVICGRTGFVEGYEVGRGRVVLRARYHIEDLKKDKKQIVFTEIPYQINKLSIIEKIVECVKDKKIESVSDVKDESDREGMRLIVELKRGEDHEVAVNQLFKYTSLQATQSMNSIALVKGKPLRLGLKSMMEHYLDHRIIVIRRKVVFLLKKAELRAHILEGLRIAIDHIDAIIAIIRASKDTKSAHQELMERFALSDIQTTAILDMQLRRLTGLERDKIEEEYKEVLTKIAEYKEVLANENLVFDVIRKDLTHLKEKYGTPRRSEIGISITDFDREDLIPDEEMTVMLSQKGYIKRGPLEEFKTQKRGGKGVIGMGTNDDDFTEFMMVASTKDYLLLFTNQGRVYWIKVYTIPLMSRTGKGRALVNIVNMEEGEKILTAIPISKFENQELVMVTANGIVKKTSLSAYSRPRKVGLKAIVLDETDTLIDVKVTSGQDDLILSTRMGMSIRFSEEECRSLGRVSRGVKGMNLKEGDKVVSANVVSEEGNILTICANGYGKKTKFSEFRCLHRGGKGVKTISNIERNGEVIRSLTVSEEDEVLFLTSEGKVVRIATAKLRTQGRATSGVRLVLLGKNDKIGSVVQVMIKEEAENVEASEAEEGESTEADTEGQPEEK